MKKGFSMAEMLVALGIIAVILSITIPVINQSTTSNTKTLFKAAYKNVETVINELINDVSIYPSGEFSNNTFCSNFFAKVNTIGSTSCSNTFNSVIPATPNATTSNGMRWYNMDNNFGTDICPDSASGNCVKISVDVNGSGKGLNTNSGTARDILDIYVFNTGKVTVPAGSLEETYLTH